MLWADFRELFAVSPRDVPLLEACVLLRALLVDPRSRLAAALSGWHHTASAEWMLLARIHDVILDTTPGLKNTSSYYVPRPWKGAKRRVTRRSTRSRDEVRRILRPTTQ